MLYRCGLCSKDFEVPGPGNYYCPHCKGAVNIPGASAGLDWERRKEIGWVKAFWQTVKASLSDPGRFFDSVSPQGGYESPILYGMACLCIGILFSTLYQTLFQSFGFLLRILMHQRTEEVALGAGVYLTIMVAVLITSPIAAFIQLFFHSAIYHLFVMLFGGNKRGYEATFRAFAYSQGPQLFQVIPFLGSLVAIVWFYILLIQGFKKLQGCSTGQAVAAAFVPLLLICALAALLIFGIIALVVGILSSAHHGAI
ncbi:MAG: YIP1 family protein [bacterium]